jgi:signal transduction histidine kinase
MENSVDATPGTGGGAQQSISLASRIGRFLRRPFRLRGQLIVPYVLLSMVTAMVGILIVTRLVTSSIRERFVNQLYEASRVASDGVVRRERAQLQSLRLMAYTVGVPEALAGDDQAAVVALLEPLALNQAQDAVVALDRRGREVAGLMLRSGRDGYDVTRGSDLSGQPFVQAVLSGERDSLGDKYVGVVSTSYGSFLFTSAPVLGSGGEIVGALLLGTDLKHLTDELKGESLADIAIETRSGDLLASTLPPSDEGWSALLLPSDQAGLVAGTQIREFGLYGRRYQGAYSPWLVRGASLGVLIVVLPSNFLVTAEATSRGTFSVVFSLGTLAVMLAGYFLAQSIARPILRLRSMAQAVAGGDLMQSSGLARKDEIGDLASAFDTMTEHLRLRTQEAERLYAEALDRNRQLQEMYDQVQAAQRQLVQSEKLAAVGQLAAGIVHDVKNPLAVIKGVAEEMMESQEREVQEAESLQVIRDNAGRASTIVSDLLVFARQTGAAMVPRDLCETVEGSLRLTAYLVRKANIRLAKDLPDRELIIRHDGQQIQQVLINLIQNAIQAMPDGGTLKIGLTGNEDGAVIHVEDTGLGISPENILRVFDPFFTTKPEGQGTGMGLSVSYGIVSRHGGVIEVESTPGQGTVFTVRLPKEPPSQPGEREEPR